MLLREHYLRTEAKPLDDDTQFLNRLQVAIPGDRDNTPPCCVGGNCSCHLSG